MWMQSVDNNVFENGAVKEDESETNRYRKSHVSKNTKLFLASCI